MGRTVHNKRKQSGRQKTVSNKYIKEKDASLKSKQNSKKLSQTSQVYNSSSEDISNDVDSTQNFTINQFSEMKERRYASSQYDSQKKRKK